MNNPQLWIKLARKLMHLAPQSAKLVPPLAHALRVATGGMATAATVGGQALTGPSALRLYLRTS